MKNSILSLLRSGKSTLGYDDGDKIRSEKWPVDDFLKLSPFNRNRFVEPRVKKKREELKKKFLLTHLEVKVGRAIKDFGSYKAGDLFINDGNTRAMTWTKYPELKPTLPLMVTIMDIDNEEDSEGIYYSIDSTTSVETSQQKIGGYFRSINYTPVSKRMKEGKISTSVNDCTKFIEYFGDTPQKNATIFDKMSFIWKELEFIDKWNMDSIKKFSSNLHACLIMVARKYGCDNERFLKLLEHIKYETFDLNDKQYCDGIHHVMVNLFRDNTDKWYITGHKKSPELMYEMLYSLDCYMKNIPITKKKNYSVSKNQKHRELFESYMD